MGRRRGGRRYNQTAGEVTDQIAAGKVTDQWQLGRLQTKWQLGRLQTKWQLGRLQKLNGSWEGYKLQYQLERAAGKVIAARKVIGSLAREPQLIAVG